MKARESHIASIIVGRKHTGKSTRLAKIAKQYPRDKRVLIIDVNMSPAYAGITQIQPSQLPRWKSQGGVVKIVGVPSNETLDIIAENFRDGLIIYEDCTKYIPGNIPPKILAFLVDHRMHRCDLIFTFHALKRVAPQFWEMISFVTLLKTQENAENARNKDVIPNYEKVLAAWRRVMANKDDYYAETVETLI